MGREFYLVDKKNKRYWYLGKNIDTKELEVMDDEKFNDSYKDPRPNHPENIKLKKEN
jgi:hypothetical protein